MRPTGVCLWPLPWVSHPHSDTSSVLSLMPLPLPPPLPPLTLQVRIVLRLDGNPRMVAAQQALPTADLSKKEGLGNVEESVISKYGGDAAADEDEEEDEDEEDEE